MLYKPIVSSFTSVTTEKRLVPLTKVTSLFFFWIPAHSHDCLSLGFPHSLPKLQYVFSVLLATSSQHWRIFKVLPVFTIPPSPHPPVQHV